MSRRGVTLPELLVAVIISGLVISMVTTMFRGESRNFRVVRDKVELQSDGREAVRLMEHELLNMGFRKGIDLSGGALAPVLVECSDVLINPTGGDSSSFAFLNRSTIAGDSLSFRFHVPLNGTSVTCGGFQEVAYRFDPATATLQRRFGIGGAWVPFLENVVTFQVQYGEFATPNDIPISDAHIAIAANWITAGGLTVSAPLTVGGFATTLRSMRTTSGFAVTPGDRIRLEMDVSANAALLDTVTGAHHLGLALVDGSGNRLPGDTLRFAAHPVAGTVRTIVHEFRPRRATTAHLQLFGQLRATSAGSPALNIHSIRLRRPDRGRIIAWHNAPTTAQKNRVRAVRIWLLVRTDGVNNETVASTWTGLGDLPAFTPTGTEATRSHVLYQRIVRVVNNGN